MGLIGYVLSGQRMQWKIPNNINVTRDGKFIAVVNMDLREQILPLSP